MNQILLAATQFSSMKSTALAIQTEKIKGYLASNQSPKKSSSCSLSTTWGRTFSVITCFRCGGST